MGAEVIRRKSKKAQVTLFVIVAILLIAGVAVVSFVSYKKSAAVSPYENPRLYIEKCAEEALLSAEKATSENGGFVNPAKYSAYNRTKPAYLCYAEENEELCTNMHPMLNKEAESEILGYVKPKIENCFNELKKRLDVYGYQTGEMNLAVEISANELSAKITKRISYNKGEQLFTMENFGAKINSPYYKFISLALEIINQEVSCGSCSETCNADTLALSLANRDFEIRKMSYKTNGDEIYGIEEINTGKKFNFAVRNCAREI